MRVLLLGATLSFFLNKKNQKAQWLKENMKMQ